MNELHYQLTDIDGVFVLALSLLLGFEVIRNVPAVLHTPLMSGSNAISGIILFGGITQLLAAGPGEILAVVLSSLAILLGAVNMAGGFFVTHRMLNMFRATSKRKTEH